MDERIEGRICRAAGLREGSAASRRLLEGVLAIVRMREQSSAGSDDQRTAAASAFRDAVDHLRSATGTSAAWAQLVEHGCDEEVLSILRRLAEITDHLASASAPAKAHRGDSKMRPLQAQVGFARSLMTACRRDAEREDPSAVSEPDLRRFSWLVHALLENGDLPAEGSEREAAAVRAFSSGDDTRGPA